MKDLEERFGPSKFEDVQGNMSELTQERSIVEYQTQFTSLLSCFIFGLQPMIR